MNIRDLRRLIAQGESQSLEFKKKVTHAYKLAKTIAAFANTHGGKILVGVLDNGNIIGTDADEQIFQLEKAANYFCRPPVPLDFQEIENEEGKVVLIADVYESEEKPHEALDKRGEWHIYARAADTSILAGETLIRSMRKGLEKNNRSLNKHELLIYDYINKTQRVTTKQAAQLFNLSERRVRRMLIELTRDGWLLSHDHEKETFYTLA